MAQAKRQREVRAWTRKSHIPAMLDSVQDLAGVNPRIPSSSRKETTNLTGHVETLGQAPPWLSEDECARMRRNLEKAVARVCPSSLVDRKDDLVHVAMMRVMEVARRSVEQRQFSLSYLHRAAYSALVDELRRLRNRREDPLDNEDSASEMSSREPGPEQVVKGREIARALQECLSQLHPPRRLAVVLHLQGEGVSRSAELLGWKPKRVENLVYRGIRDLRACLSARGLQP